MPIEDEPRTYRTYERYTCWLGSAGIEWKGLPYSQIINLFQRRPASAADDSAAVPTHQRVCHFRFANRAVERFALAFL